MNKLDYNYLAELLYPHIKTTPEDMEKKYKSEEEFLNDYNSDNFTKKEKTVIMV